MPDGVRWCGGGMAAAVADLAGRRVPLVSEKERRTHGDDGAAAVAVAVLVADGVRRRALSSPAAAAAALLDAVRTRRDFCGSCRRLHAAAAPGNCEAAIDVDATAAALWDGVGLWWCRYSPLGRASCTRGGGGGGEARFSATAVRDAAVGDGRRGIASCSAANGEGPVRPVLRLGAGCAYVALRRPLLLAE